MQAAAQGLFQYLTQFLQALDILTIKYKAMNALNNTTKRSVQYAHVVVVTVVVVGWWGGGGGGGVCTTARV